MAYNWYLVNVSWIHEYKVNELTSGSGKIAHESSFKFAKFNKYKGTSYSNKNKLFFIWNSNLNEHPIFYLASLHLGEKKLRANVCEILKELLKEILKYWNTKGNTKGIVFQDCWWI